MTRWLVLGVALLSSVPAWAGGIAVVDFQRAVNETEEGKQAQTTLDSMYSAKKAEIDQMRTKLEKKVKDYQARQPVLSADARQKEEMQLAQENAVFEQTYMQYQQEMQQQYFNLLEGLDQKMRALTVKIAKEKAYDLVIDNAAVVYRGGTTVDMTDVLIQRYNSGK